MYSSIRMSILLPERASEKLHLWHAACDIYIHTETCMDSF